jgi:hypothetical protein
MRRSSNPVDGLHLPEWVSEPARPEYEHAQFLDEPEQQMTTIVENTERTTDVVEVELRNLAEVRENPPSRASIREMLPQANGDQDTW